MVAGLATDTEMHPTYETARRVNWAVWFEPKDVSVLEAAVETPKSWMEFLHPEQLPDDASDLEVQAYRRRHRLVFRARTMVYDRVIDILHGSKGTSKLPYYLRLESTDEDDPETDTEKGGRACKSRKAASRKGIADAIKVEAADSDDYDKMDVEIEDTDGYQTAASLLTRQNLRHLDELYYTLEVDADDWVDTRRKELGEPEVDEFSDKSSLSAGDDLPTTPKTKTEKDGNTPSAGGRGRRTAPRRSSRHTGTAGDGKDKGTDSDQDPATGRSTRRGGAESSTKKLGSQSTASTDDTKSAAQLQRRTRQAQFNVLLQVVEGKETRKQYVPQPGHTDLDRLNFYIERVLSEVRAYEVHSFPFHRGVKKSEAPDYYEVISHPMDLSIMAKKMRSNEYLSKRQIEDDFALMFHNCRKYNQLPGNPYLEHAAKTEQLANALLVEIPNIIVPESMVPKPDADDAKGARQKKRKKGGQKGRRTGPLATLQTEDDNMSSLAGDGTVGGSDDDDDEEGVVAAAGVTRSQAAAIAAQKDLGGSKADLSSIANQNATANAPAGSMAAFVEVLEDTRDRYSDLHEREYRTATAALRVRRLAYRRRQMALPFVDQDAFQRNSDAMGVAAAMFNPHDGMPTIHPSAQVLGPTYDVLSAVVSQPTQHTSMGLRKDTHSASVAASAAAVSLAEESAAVASAPSTLTGAGATEVQYHPSAITDSSDHPGIGTFPELFNPTDSILEMHARPPAPGKHRYLVPFHPTGISDNLDRISRIKELKSKIHSLKTSAIQDDHEESPLMMETSMQAYPVFPLTSDTRKRTGAARLNAEGEGTMNGSTLSRAKRGSKGRSSRTRRGVVTSTTADRSDEALGLDDSADSDRFRDGPVDTIAHGVSEHDCGTVLETSVLQNACHAGFDTVSQSCIDVLRDVVSDTMTKFGRTLHYLNNTYAGKMGDNVLLAEALHHLNLDPVALWRYVKEEIPHHGQRLQNLEQSFQDYLQQTMNDPSWTGENKDMDLDNTSDVSESDIGFLTGEFDGYDIDILGLGDMGIDALIPASFLGSSPRSRKPRTRVTAQQTKAASHAAATAAAVAAAVAAADAAVPDSTAPSIPRPAFWVDPPPAWPPIDPMAQIEVVKGYLQKRAKDSTTGVVPEDTVRTHQEIFALRRKQQNHLRDQAKARKEAQAAKEAATAAAKAKKKSSTKDKTSTPSVSRKTGSSSKKGDKESNSSKKRKSSSTASPAGKNPKKARR